MYITYLTLIFFLLPSMSIMSSESQEATYKSCLTKLQKQLCSNILYVPIPTTEQKIEKSSQKKRLKIRAYIINKRSRHLLGGKYEEKIN